MEFLWPAETPGAPNDITEVRGGERPRHAKGRINVRFSARDIYVGPYFFPPASLAMIIREKWRLSRGAFPPRAFVNPQLKYAAAKFTRAVRPYFYISRRFVFMDCKSESSFFALLIKRGSFVVAVCVWNFNLAFWKILSRAS